MLDKIVEELYRKLGVELSEGKRIRLANGY